MQVELLGELFNASANDATDDGSHAQRWNVKSGRKFYSDGEYGHNNFENQC